MKFCFLGECFRDREEYLTFGVRGITIWPPKNYPLQCKKKNQDFWFEQELPVIKQIWVMSKLLAGTKIPFTSLRFEVFCHIFRNFLVLPIKYFESSFIVWHDYTQSWIKKLFYKKEKAYELFYGIRGPSLLFSPFWMFWVVHMLTIIINTLKDSNH